MLSKAEILEIQLEQCGIPDYMWDGVINYILYGIEPGSFLSSVIVNNLREAVANADDNNIKLLPNYINFFYNYAPSGCWGDRESMKHWTELQRKVLRNK